MVFSAIQLEVLLLIIARIIGLFVVAPFFSSKTIANVFKMTFVFMFAILLWFVVPFQPSLLPKDAPMFLIAMINEFLIGLILGSVVDIIFSGVEAAGELMGSQMGLSVSAMLDPSTGQQSTITARILGMIVMLLFLMIDGHHFLLTALYKSYDVLPMLHSWNFAKGGLEIANLGGSIFAIAMQLSAPILLVIFLLDFSFGLISRVAPQINVFNLGFQVKPALGIFIFLMMLPLLTERIMWIISIMLEKLTMVLFFLR